jgi:hypothetical protein
MEIGLPRPDDHVMALRTFERSGRATAVAVPGTWVWWPRFIVELVVFGRRDMSYAVDATAVGERVV